MVRIGDVWDSTTDVLAGRTGLLAPLAAGALVVPPLLQAALLTWGPAGLRGSGAVGAALILIVALVALWGRLAITAIAMDPATTAPAARAQAGRALPPLIGVLLVLGAAAIVLVSPVLYAMSAAGFNWAAVAAGQRPTMPALGPGTSLYILGLLALALWANARIRLLLTPLVLGEGRVIGAIGRAVTLTKGLTWKLIGVVLLYYVALLVSVRAASSVVGAVGRLLLGGDSALAPFLAAAVGVVVAALFDTIAHVFGARLYAATSARPV